jgi:O-antigen ligase
MLILGITTIELAALFVVAVGAVFLLNRPYVLACTAIIITVFVNSGWIPIPPESRFVLLAALCSSLLLGRAMRQAVKPLSLRIHVVLFVISAVLMIDMILHSSNPTTLFRALSFQFLLFAISAIPGILSGYQLQRLWRTLFRALFIYLVIGTAIRLVVLPGGAFTDRGFRGPMENPNALGLLAGAALVYYICTVRPLRRAVWTVVPLMVFVIASGSRGAAFAVVAGIASNYILRNGVRRIVGIGSIVLVFLLFGGRLLSQLSTESRWIVWSDALRSSATHPLSGVGFGGTEEQLSGGLFRVPISFQGFQLHNSYVQAIFELGFVLGLVFLASLGWLLYTGLSSTRVSPVQTLRPVVVYGLVGALAESWMFSTGSVFALIFWLAVGSLWPRSPARDPGIAILDSKVTTRSNTVAC